MSYTVTGAVVTIEGGYGTALADAAGTQFPVAQFTATVQIPPSSATSNELLVARTPPFPATFLCRTESAQVPTFRDGPRGEGEVVAMSTLGFPPGGVATNEVIDIGGPLVEPLRKPAAAGFGVGFATRLAA